MSPLQDLGWRDFNGYLRTLGVSICEFGRQVSLLSPKPLMEIPFSGLESLAVGYVTQESGY